MTSNIGDPFPILPSWPPSPGYVFSPPPPPRTMPVNVPFSIMGVTVVVMDRDGNITIKVDQVQP